MTKRILIFLFILSVSLYPQKVNVEVDEFTGEKNISTSWEKIAYDTKSGLVLHARYLHKNNEIILECVSLFDPNSAIVVTSGSPLAFKFDNNNIIILNSIDYAIAVKGGGSVSGAFGSYQWDGVHLRYKFKSQEDARNFSDSLASSVRFSYNGTQGGLYRDGKVKSKDAEKLQKAYKMFKEEIDKLNLASN